jgi:hypothetical protein
MKFRANEWKRCYDRTQELGRLLKRSRPDKDGNPPIAPLHPVTQSNLEGEIKRITTSCSQYLDSCGMTMKEPLWKYKIDDEKTWISSPHFAYHHLVE